MVISPSGSREEEQSLESLEDLRASLDALVDLETASTCTVCRKPTREQPSVCPSCRSIYHPECWTYRQGCARRGCEAAPKTRVTLPAMDPRLPEATSSSTEPETATVTARIPATVTSILAFVVFGGLSFLGEVLPGWIEERGQEKPPAQTRSVEAGESRRAQARRLAEADLVRLLDDKRCHIATAAARVLLKRQRRDLLQQLKATLDRCEERSPEALGLLQQLKQKD